MAEEDRLIRPIEQGNSKPVTLEIYDEDTRRAIAVSSDNPLPINIVSPLESNSAVPVNIQDQHTEAIDANLTYKINTTSLNGAVTLGAFQITLTAGHGAVVGNMISLFTNGVVAEGYIGEVTAVSTNLITLDTPVDYSFPDLSIVLVTDDNLGSANGNGSQSSPKIYSIQAPPIGLEFDITRLMFQMTTETAVSLATFGDLPKLVNGLVLRITYSDGSVHNLMNLKDNFDISLHAFDVNFFLATNPQQGVDGLASRMTWAGQSKRGVVLRLEGGGKLEAVIQDDISGLTTFHLQAQMHVVTD